MLSLSDQVDVSGSRDWLHGCCGECGGSCSVQVHRIWPQVYYRGALHTVSLNKSHSRYEQWTLCITWVQLKILVDAVNCISLFSYGHLKDCPPRVTSIGKQLVCSCTTLWCHVYWCECNNVCAGFAEFVQQSSVECPGGPGSSVQSQRALSPVQHPHPPASRSSAIITHSVGILPA